MIFSQTLDLFLNLRGPQFPATFFASRHAGSARPNAPQFIVGDRVLLRLWLCSTPQTEGQPLTLHRANGPIAFAIKKELGSENLLAFTAAFQLTDDSTDGSEPHYEADLNLATNELQALFASGVTDIRPRLDIELQAQGNTRRITYATPAQICAQAYQGTEVTPVPATPAYPPPGDIPSKINIENLIAAAVSNHVQTAVAAAIANLDALVAEKIAAATEGYDDTIATAVTEMKTLVTKNVKDVTDTIPRITGAFAEPLPHGQSPTASLVPILDGPYAMATLFLGIPAGRNGTDGQNGANGINIGNAITGSKALVKGEQMGIITFPERANTPTPVVTVRNSGQTAPQITAVVVYISKKDFAYMLSAPPPHDGYALNYIL